MWLKCINNISSNGFLNISVGNNYKVINIDNNGYKIIDDKENCLWYFKGNFEKIEDMRENKINLIIYKK